MSKSNPKFNKRSTFGLDKATKKRPKFTNRVYLDYAASVLPNPSSIHKEGVEAKGRLEHAREDIAVILGARTSEIVFTSGGTESNNLAIQGVVLAWQEKNQGKSTGKKILPHIITTNIEHPSVLLTCELLRKRKLAQISVVPVEANGIVDPKKIKKEIKKNTVLVSVMYANNEIGTIQPIKEIAKVIRHYNKISKNPRGTLGETYPLFHVDAVQAANYLDLNVEKLGVDLLSLSGSKIEGSGRTGVLYKRKSAPLIALFGGGDQEMGFRPGTENLSEILKFIEALKFTDKIKIKEVKRLTKLKDYFVNKIFQNVRNSAIAENLANYKIILNGDLEYGLPNIVNITIPEIPSDLLVIELSARGIMTSAKSACKSGDGEASHVIKAIRQAAGKILAKDTDGSLRFSLGRQTTKDDIDYTVKSLSQILIKLKKWYS